VIRLYLDVLQPEYVILFLFCTLEEEIRERIAEGNKAFYANKALFKSNLVSRKSKLKLYWSVIRPTVVYGCETWALKESII